MSRFIRESFLCVYDYFMVVVFSLYTQDDKKNTSKYPVLIFLCSVVFAWPCLMIIKDI